MMKYLYGTINHESFPIHLKSYNYSISLSCLHAEKKNEALEGRLRRPKKGATLLLRDALKYDENDAIDGDEEQVVETDPNVYVKTKVKDLTFRFLAGNFFQNNPL